MTINLFLAHFVLIVCSGDCELYYGGVQVWKYFPLNIGNWTLQYWTLQYLTLQYWNIEHCNIGHCRFSSTLERQKRLNEGWAFPCNCTICTTGHLQTICTTRPTRTPSSAIGQFISLKPPNPLRQILKTQL